MRRRPGHSRIDDAHHHAELVHAVSDASVDMLAFEKDKIQGAVRTDFILSAEIIVIALGTVASSAFMTQVAVLVGTAMLMTVGVYGLVAGIVKLDDLGLYLSRRASALSKGVGSLLVRAAPWLMRFLAVAGTAAMFLVGGSILGHGIAPVHHLIEVLTRNLGSPLAAIGAALLDGLVGVVAGALVLGAVTLASRLRGR